MENPSNPKKRELVGRLKRYPDYVPKPLKKNKDGTLNRICGVKNKTTGKPCMSIRLMKNGRCRIHGGRNNTKKIKDEHAPRVASIKTGIHTSKKAEESIYASSALLTDELPVYDSVTNKLGTLDDELTMARIKLRRAYKAQKELDEIKDSLQYAAAADKREFINLAAKNKLITQDHAQMYLDASDEHFQLTDFAKTRIIHRLCDYSDEIAKFTELVKKLETARKELLATTDMGDDVVRRLAEDLRAFGENADGLMQDQMGTGNYKDI